MRGECVAVCCTQNVVRNVDERGERNLFMSLEKADQYVYEVEINTCLGKSAQYIWQEGIGDQGELHCIVLQCVAVCCGVLQCVCVRSIHVWERVVNIFQYIWYEGIGDLGELRCIVVVVCSVLQCVAVCCSVLQCVAVCCSVQQCVAPRMWLVLWTRR